MNDVDRRALNTQNFLLRGELEAVSLQDIAQVIFRELLRIAEDMPDDREQEVGLAAFGEAVLKDALQESQDGALSPTRILQIKIFQKAQRKVSSKITLESTWRTALENTFSQSPDIQPLVIALLDSEMAQLEQDRTEEFAYAREHKRAVLVGIKDRLIPKIYVKSI